MDIDESLNFKNTTHQSSGEIEHKESQNSDNSAKDSNKLTSCTGEISEETLRNIQEDLDRAKEDYNSFSSKPNCVICWLLWTFSSWNRNKTL